MTSEWMSMADLATYLDVAPRTLSHWRRAGRLPRAYLMGHQVRFRRSTVEAWIEAQLEPERDADD